MCESKRERTLALLYYPKNKEREKQEKISEREGRKIWQDYDLTSFFSILGQKGLACAKYRKFYLVHVSQKT